MNPLSRAFLLKRQQIIRGYLNGGSLLDIGASVHPIKPNAITLDIKAWKKPTICGSALCLPIRDKSFDTVNFAEVIEHIDYQSQELALSEIRRVTRRTLVISTPSMFPCWRIIWFIWEHTIQNEYRHEHVGQLHRNELLIKLKKHGFKPVRAKRIMLFDYIVKCN